MTVKKQETDELLGLDKFAVDEENAHILLDKDACAACKDKPCLVICPAKLYKLNEKGEVLFDYAGCLECGTCKVICHKLKKWQYPAGTMGISFRYG